MKRGFFKDPQREERWTVISGQYREFDQRIEEFIRESGAACPPGCGICCTSEYEPEVTSGEAEFCARYIIEVRQDLQNRFERIHDRRYCIFYDEQNPLHCMIYPVRPVICRGFGFSGYTDKNGRFSYRPCKYMDKPQESRGVLSGPLISDCQAQYTLDYQEKLPISEAIFTAWQKLCYYLSLDEGTDPEYQ